MKKRWLLTLILVCAIGVYIYSTFSRGSDDVSLSIPSQTNAVSEDELMSDAEFESEIELEENDILWIDTVMYAKGHAFGFSGDITKWGGWYLDTVCVGNDNMLQYDSVGPSALKLSLVTRELTIDLGDSNAIAKIKNFMNPIDGFRRFCKRYEECIDSIHCKEFGFDKYTGGFSFEVDLPDSCNENGGKINRFICELAGLSESEKAKVSGMEYLSDFLANKKFEKWKRGVESNKGSSDATLAIRPHIANKRFVTFSKYEYEREGIGHGMYTETFHTFDMKNGKELRNKDIFKDQSLDNVKMKLFEVMAKDHKWHDGPVLPADIEGLIDAWYSPSPIHEGTEREKPERDVKFELRDGALTNSGVLFSFQPYEIDGWAAGAYHFIVPYKNLMPYLTPEAKKLIAQ